jgi:DNA-binding transcriptional ArsR family regulator
MVNNKSTSSKLDDAFAALAHPIRRGILEQLVGKEAPVGALASRYHVSAPAITKHLKILEAVGLLSKRREGQILWCRAEEAPMKEVTEWIAHYRRFWNGRFDALDHYLKTKQKKEK